MRLPRPLPGAEAPASPFLNTLSSLAAICSTQPATSSGVRGHSFPLLGCRQRPCGCWGVGFAATSLPVFFSGVLFFSVGCSATSLLSFSSSLSSGTGFIALGFAASSLSSSSSGLPFFGGTGLDVLGCAGESLPAFSSGWPSSCRAGLAAFFDTSAGCLTRPASLMCCLPSLETSTWKNQLRAVSLSCTSPIRAVMVWTMYLLSRGFSVLWLRASWYIFARTSKATARRPCMSPSFAFPAAAHMKAGA
mmetsp:Transcript_13562/g.21506  ORF Transcript_13562/g.21506 Transcript_13562/m.21506 type:complete len:248 (-) Transcript_13562:69-812(-)